MEHLAHAAGNAAVNALERPWCTGVLAVLGGVVEGGATVLRKYRRHPTAARRLTRRAAYMAVRRGLPLLQAAALLAVCRAAGSGNALSGGVAFTLALWLVYAAVVLALQVQALMLLVDVSLLHVLSLRDATVDAVPVIPAAAAGHEPVGAIAARWLGLTVMAALPFMLRLPAALHLPVAALTLGCSMHDAALRARGCPPLVRRRLWRREAVGFSLLALLALRAADCLVAVAGGGDVLGTLHGTLALLVALPLVLAAACRPLNLAATLHAQPRCARPGLLLAAVELPLTLGPELVDRAGRILRSGALAPDPRRPPPPPLRLLLRLGGYLATPLVRALLPADLTSPALQGLVADAVAPEDLAAMLTQLSDLISVKDDHLRRLAVRRLPGLTSAAVGVPRPLVEAFADVLASRSSVVQLHALQHALALRVSATRAARGQSPLTVAAWTALGLQPRIVAAWRLKVSDGGLAGATASGLVTGGGLADPHSHMSLPSQLRLARELKDGSRAISEGKGPFAVSTKSTGLN